MWIRLVLVVVALPLVACSTIDRSGATARATPIPSETSCALGGRLGGDPVACAKGGAARCGGKGHYWVDKSGMPTSGLSEGARLRCKS